VGCSPSVALSAEKSRSRSWLRVRSRRRSCAAALCSFSTLPDEAWFDVELAHKDIRLALATAGAEHVPLLSAELADEWLTKALGNGRRDLASLHAVLAQQPTIKAELAHAVGSGDTGGSP
jgi:3-hydroxyisobutyrate dehydrogenase-like beta-hydroxyacid dehydrogenase